MLGFPPPHIPLAPLGMLGTAAPIPASPSTAALSSKQMEIKASFFKSNLNMKYEGVEK